MEKKVAINEEGIWFEFQHHLLLMANGLCSIHCVFFWYGFNTAALITLSIVANRSSLSMAKRDNH